MNKKLELSMQPQPDDTTCGPTCLQAVYAYYGRNENLPDLIRRVPELPGKGTLGVLLGLDALELGFKVTVYTYNLKIFDPTWFKPDGPDMADRLRQQLQHRRSPRFRMACSAYLEFINRGGVIRMEDLNSKLIRHYMKRDMPILCGLSSTYLYRDMREYGPDMKPDDVRGEPAGHFVVLHGYDRKRRTVDVADPYAPNPISKGLHHYTASIDRVVNAILLGVITYDANLVIIEPPSASTHPEH